MKKKCIALLCTFTLILAGCSHSSGKQEPSADTPATEHTSQESSAPEATPDDAATTDTENADASPVLVTYTKNSETYYATDNQTALFYTDYSNPSVEVTDNPDASDAIANTLTEAQNNFNDAAKSYLLDAKTDIHDNPDSFSAYYLSQSYETQRCDEQVVSLKGLMSDFTGGAHGNYTYTGLNFDTKTGKKLTLNDIASDKEALLESAASYIYSQLELPFYGENLMQPLEECQDIIMDTVLKDGNWYFTDSGLTFVSNIYVLSNYAGGAFFFTVPYQQLEGLKADYQYTGNFELSGIVGSTLSADLNGDENVDAVYYDVNADSSDGNLSCTLTINGTDFSSELQSTDCTLTSGAVSYDGLQYYLIDLDTTDDFIELAIQDMGTADDEKTYFFRYDGSELFYLGVIPDSLDLIISAIPGNGTITANLGITWLKTADATAVYQLEDDTLSLVSQDWYMIDYLNDSHQNHSILQPITVYTLADTDSDTVTLTSEDGPVQFLSTDNEHWFSLKTANNTLYYLYLESPGISTLGQNMEDVFVSVVVD